MFVNWSATDESVTGQWRTKKKKNTRLNPFFMPSDENNKGQGGGEILCGHKE